jgi:hypothetical protein
MKQLKHITLACAALFGFFAPANATSNSPAASPKAATILDRVARIQQKAETRTQSQSVFDNLRITQWNNWPNWPNWNNWNDNWGNWYNY